MSTPPSPHLPPTYFPARAVPNLAREVSLSVAYIPQCATSHGIFCLGDTLACIKSAALERFGLIEDGEVQYKLYGMRLETTYQLLAGGFSEQRTEVARVVLNQDGTLYDALVTLFGPLAAPAVPGCAFELVRERMLRPRDGNRAAVFDPVEEIAREMRAARERERPLVPAYGNCAPGPLAPGEYWHR